MASTLLYNNYNHSDIAAPRPVYGSRLRHVVPARTFNKFMDSSEDLPSEHDSICNAILVSYEADEVEGEFLHDSVVVEVEGHHI